MQPQRNNLIKLAHYANGETKKRAHNSQRVRAKENMVSPATDKHHAPNNG